MNQGRKAELKAEQFQKKVAAKFKEAVRAGLVRIIS